MSEYRNIDTTVVDNYRKSLLDIVNNSMETLNIITEEIEDGSVLSNAPYRVSLNKLTSIIGSNGFTLIKNKLKNLNDVIEKIKKYQSIDDTEENKSILFALESEIDTLLA